MTCFANCNLFSILFQTIFCTLKFCIGLIAISIFFICLILLKLIFSPWKCFVFVAMKLSGKTNISFMKGKDAVFLAETNTARKYLTSVTVLESSADLHFTRTLLQKQLLSPDGKDDLNSRERLLFAPYYSCGYWFWEDKSKEFNINLHVKVMDGIDENNVVTESHILNHLSNTVNEPLPNEKPMWEVLYVPRFKYDKDADNQEPHHLCVYIARFQHIYGDAVTLTKDFLFRSLKPPAFSHIKQPQLSLAHTFYLISQGITEIGNLVLHPKSPEKSPIFGPELTGDKLLCASEKINFDVIRKIRKKYKMSVYSILITTVTDALNKYFTKKSLDVPVSLRVTFNIVTKFPKPENFDLRNNAIAWVVPIINDRVKPQEKRFSKITEDVDHSISFMLFRGKFLQPILFWSLSDCPFLFIKLLASIPVSSSLFVANVPASMVDTTFDGKHVYGHLGFAPHHGKLGLTTTFFTFGGKVRMGLHVDKALIGKREDAELIVKYWEECVRELSSD